MSNARRLNPDSVAPARARVIAWLLLVVVTIAACAKHDRSVVAAVAGHPGYRVQQTVALRGAGTRRGRIDWTVVSAQTERLMLAYDVRAENTSVPMRTLSGGNQQKLVLARELEHASASERALVAENPTRGLDVKATADIHARLRGAALDGAAIVLYSSDIDEVLLLAHRVFVVFERVVRELPLDRERIGHAMVGAA